MQNQAALSGIVNLWVADRVGANNTRSGKAWKMTYQGGDGNDGNQIVELTQFRGQNVRPILAQVEACWEEVRGNRLVPARSEIAPQSLQGALSHVFILERISTGLARFRIAGSHLTDLMGTEVRGLPTSVVFEAASRENLSDAMQAVFDDPAVVRLQLRAAQGFGRPELIGDMMLMPLRSDLGEISRALGVVAMSGDIGRGPRKLEITGQSRRGLVGFAGDDPAHVRGFSETDDQTRIIRSSVQNPQTERPKATASRAAHLRLVADNTPAE